MQNRRLSFENGIPALYLCHMHEILARGIDGVGLGRSNQPAPMNIPLALRTAVHKRVSQGRFPPVQHPRILLAKWVIAGQAAIGVEGRRLKFGPGEVALHLPADPHQFWVLSESANMCWFSADGPLAEEFVMAMGIKSGVYRFGEAPVDRIDEMVNSLRDYSMSGERRSSLLAIRMLYDIADRIGTSQLPSVVQQAQQVIHAEFSDPDLNVDNIAQRLHYHRGSLSRVFHKHAGITIMNYVTQVRLQHARTLLTNTEDRIGDIAVKCGFREPNYFCRWISKHTGIAPSKLRRDWVV
jgi:AraC-like DNA-binding protein